ncbi:hypothetical protein D3C76_1096780 [compost metagenome]
MGFSNDQAVTCFEQGFEDRFRCRALFKGRYNGTCFLCILLKKAFRIFKQGQADFLEMLDGFVELRGGEIS